MNYHWAQTIYGTEMMVAVLTIGEPLANTDIS